MQATNAQATSEQRPEVRPGCENVSTIRRCPLALLACISEKGLSTPWQYSRRGGCGSGCAPICLQALGPVQGGAQMSTWLTTIVINSARMQLRRRSRHLHLSLDEQIGEEREYSLSERMADHGPSPEDECRESQLHEHVRQLLTQLSPQLRNALCVARLGWPYHPRSSGHSGSARWDSEGPAHAGTCEDPRAYTSIARCESHFSADRYSSVSCDHGSQTSSGDEKGTILRSKSATETQSLAQAESRKFSGRPGSLRHRQTTPAD